MKDMKQISEIAGKTSYYYHSNHMSHIILFVSNDLYFQGLYMTLHENLFSSIIEADCFKGRLFHLQQLISFESYGLTNNL